MVDGLERHIFHQPLGVGHRPGGAGHDLPSDPVTRGLQARQVGDHLGDQADLLGVGRIEDPAGGEQAPRRPGPDGGDHIGADGGGHEPQPHLGEGEPRIGHRHGQVAGRHQPGPAAEPAALHQGHGQGRHVPQTLQHPRQLQGVVAVVGLGVVHRRLHPVQVRPGAEHAAGAAQEHHPHPLGPMQGLEGLVQGADQLVIEGVLPLRPVQGDGGDPVRRRLDGHQVGADLAVRALDQGVGDGIGHGRLLRDVGIGLAHFSRIWTPVRANDMRQIKGPRSGAGSAWRDARQLCPGIHGCGPIWGLMPPRLDPLSQIRHSPKG